MNNVAQVDNLYNIHTFFRYFIDYIIKMTRKKEFAVYNINQILSGCTKIKILFIKIYFTLASSNPLE